MPGKWRRATVPGDMQMANQYLIADVFGIDKFTGFFKAEVEFTEETAVVTSSDRNAGEPESYLPRNGEWVSVVDGRRIAIFDRVLGTK